MIKKPDIVIVGNGIDALLCGYILMKNKSINLKMLKCGLDNLYNDFFYIKRTDNMKKIFEETNIPYSVSSIRRGILLKEKKEEYPSVFENFKKQEIVGLKNYYYRKTRLKEPSNNDFKDAFSDAPGQHGRKTFNTNRELFSFSLINLLRKMNGRRNIKFSDDYKSDDFEFINSRLVRIKKNEIELFNGRNLKYDFLFVFEPLWKLKNKIYFDIPNSCVVRKNILSVMPIREKYCEYDIVYTPYTPYNTIYRFYFNSGAYLVEFNGFLDNDKKADVLSDLNFLFPDGWCLDRELIQCNGHLIPLKRKINWPENIFPVGKYSRWDQKTTLDQVCDITFELLKEI